MEWKIECVRLLACSFYFASFMAKIESSQAKKKKTNAGNGKVIAKAVINNQTDTD